MAFQGTAKVNSTWHRHLGQASCSVHLVQGLGPLSALLAYAYVSTTGIQCQRDLFKIIATTWTYVYPNTRMRTYVDP
jgi:hypothetical protein